MRKRDPTEIATPVSPPAPRRRLGRPPRTPGDVKRYPLSLYVTKELKDRLVAASKVSGRPLTQEIEARLLRTLDEDSGKDERELRLDNLAREITELVRRNLEAEPPFLVVGYRPPSAAGSEPLARTEPADDQRGSDQEANRDWVSGMLAEYRKPGEVASLLPAEMSLGRGDDGGLVVTLRQDGRVREIALTIEQTVQLVGDLYEAGGPGERRALLDAFGLAEKDEPAAIKPKRKSRRRA